MGDMTVGNFMKAYTIAFETDNGERVASRAIIPLFKKIEEVLEETPENVIRRINGRIMRVHAYEWNHMNEDYLVVPIGRLKEKNKPFGSDPETQKLIDIPQDMFDVNSIAYHKRYRVALLSSNQAGQMTMTLRIILIHIFPLMPNTKSAFVL